MKKKFGDTYWSWIILLFCIYFVAVSFPGDQQSVFYGDSGLRTITTYAGVNNVSDNPYVEYTINAARSANDYSQSMMMFVKINGDWYSAEGVVLQDNNNKVTNYSIPASMLVPGKNEVEFFFKGDRTHPLDTDNIRCWVNADYGARVEYRLDQDLVAWTASLYGIGYSDHSLVVDGKTYGVACSGFRRHPVLVTEPSISSDRLFITRDSSMPGDVAVESLTLKDLMDLRVNKSSYSYVKEVFYLPVTTPAPAVIQCFSDSDCGPDFYCNDKKCYLKGPIITPPTQSDDDNQPNWLIIMIVVVVVIVIIIVRFKTMKKRTRGVL